MIETIIIFVVESRMEVDPDFSRISVVLKRVCKRGANGV